MGQSNKHKANMTIGQQGFDNADALIREVILDVIPRMAEKGLIEDGFKVRAITDALRVLLNNEL